MLPGVRKQLWRVLRAVLPGVGFALACGGAYLLPPQTEADGRPKRSVVPAYVLIALGFLSILASVFWTICHSMKSKMYQRDARAPHIQFYTTERHHSFPPSYEESQGSVTCPRVATECVVVVDGVEMLLTSAPPLYSRDGREVADCTWSWERPPSYSQVEADGWKTGPSGHRGKM